MEWIRDYRTWLGTNSEYVFPGETKGCLQYDTVHNQIKKSYRKIGLKDSPDKSEIWTTHSFRTFADNQMRKFGLDSKYVSAIIGHKNKLQAEASYLDWNIIEQEWVSKCSEKMCFLSGKSKDYEQVKDENSDLKSLLTIVLQRMTSNPNVEKSKHGKEPNLNFTPLGAENPLYFESDFS